VESGEWRVESGEYSSGRKMLKEENLNGLLKITVYSVYIGQKKEWGVFF